MAAQFDVPTNALYALKAERIARGQRVVDVVSGNVGEQGICFPPRILSVAMARAGKRAARYRPDPMGQLVAREAISRWYKRQKVALPAEQILVTPGTSLSYWYAFKLVANAGDEILCPAPSYPLFESIAALAEVRLTHYPLREGARWGIDFDALQTAITPRTKALVLISPHNPTGAVATEEEVQRLAGIAARHGVAILSDEVFSPFVFDGKPLPRPARTKAPLVITLNGFSKMLALPGIKIGWMALSGDPARVRQALKTLDFISDAFLPVNEIAQFAVPDLLQKSSAFRRQYANEIADRRDAAARAFAGIPHISCAAPEGGFFMSLRLTNEALEEEGVALTLLRDHGFLTHPGYFYDMPGRHLVMSFVSRPAILRRAATAIARASTDS